MSPKPRLMVILLPGTLDWGGKGASIEGNPKTHHVHKPDRTLSTYPFDNNIVRTHRLITNRNQGTLQSTCTESVLLPFLLMGFTVEPLKYIYYSPQNQEREPMRFTVAATISLGGCCLLLLRLASALVTAPPSTTHRRTATAQQADCGKGKTSEITMASAA